MEDDPMPRTVIASALQSAGASGSVSNLLRRSNDGRPIRSDAATALGEWRDAFIRTPQAAVNEEAVSQLHTMFPAATREQVNTALRDANNELSRG